MTIAELVEFAQTKIDERCAFMERFDAGGDLEWIEEPQHRANLIGPPLMLETFIVDMANTARLFNAGSVYTVPPAWNTCHPGALRHLAYQALEHADRREAEAATHG